MKELEHVRRFLIRWNIAPLSLVALLAWSLIDGTHFYQNAACELPDWHVGAIFTYLAAIAGILYKMYDSMQKDRGKRNDRDSDEDNQA